MLTTTKREMEGAYVDTMGNGAMIDYIYPENCRFDVPDIARGMAHTCRFAGQPLRYYSLAQHCVMMSRLVPQEHAREAMLYGAAKAFCGDLPFGLKQLLPDYPGIVRSVDAAIRAQYDLPLMPSEPVEIANRIILAAAARDLMPHLPPFDLGELAPYHPRTVSWHADRALGNWLARWVGLGGSTA
jgi:hypothetical protein